MWSVFRSKKKSTKITPFDVSDMLSPVNERIGYVNNGGCGIAALAIYRQLKKRGYPVTLLSMESTRINSKHKEEYSKEFLPMLKMNRQSGTEPDRGAHAHYMVRLNGYAIDTRGSYKIKRNGDGVEFIDYEPLNLDLFVLGAISEENLEFLTNISWAWCTDFHRPNRRHVENLINKQLDKLFIA